MTVDTRAFSVHARHGIDDLHRGFQLIRFGPNMESKFRIEVRQCRRCVHHLDVEFCCQHDVGGFASQGRHGKGMSPRIHWSQSELRMGWNLMTSVGCSLTEVSGAECSPRIETSDEKDVDSNGL